MSNAARWAQVKWGRAGDGGGYIRRHHHSLETVLRDLGGLATNRLKAEMVNLKQIFTAKFQLQTSEV
jgi:hypothetical protein